MKVFEQKSKTRMEMAIEYGVCRRTFYNMLKKENIKITSGLITPVEQKLIYRKLGKPFVVKEEKGLLHET